MVRYVEFSPNYTVDNTFLNSVYDKSIWILDESSLESLYVTDPTIEKIELVKILPSKLIVKLNFHEQIAARVYKKICNGGSQPQLTILFKNLYTAESIEASKNAISVTIVNGPVDSGFNGEIVALFMTLSSFDDINVGSLKLTHSGTSIIGYYEDTEILFGSPFDLATKAASIGELLSYGNCEGTVRFITNNSFVTDCKI